MMLTKISATTAAITAVCNLLVLFGVIDWTSDQVAAINFAVVTLGTAVHTWFNPKVPFGGS